MCNYEIIKRFYKKNDFIYDLIGILNHFVVCATEKRTYVLKEIEIPSPLTVLLSLTFNHSPFCALWIYNVENNTLQILMNMRVQNVFGITFRYCFPHKTRLLESLARKTSRNPIKLHWDCVSNFSNWIWNFGIEKAKPYNNSPILPNNTTVKKIGNSHNDAYLDLFFFEKVNLHSILVSNISIQY